MRIILPSIGVGTSTFLDVDVPRHSRESLDLLHILERIPMIGEYEITVKLLRADGMIHGYFSMVL